MSRRKRLSINVYNVISALFVGIYWMFIGFVYLCLWAVFGLDAIVLGFALFGLFELLRAMIKTSREIYDA